MKKIVRFLAVSLAAAIALSAKASAEDVLKVAGVHRGVWESAATELGQQAGIFKKYGIVLDLIHLDEVKEIIQSVASAKADIGVGVGTMSAIQAYAYGAPIRIIGASMAGSVNYWYVLKSSPVRSIKNIDGKTIAYERNGSSSQYDALDLMRKYDIKAKLILTGRPEATFASVNAGIVDVGWGALPFGVDKIEQGDIRVVARANDLPEIRNKTFGVIITNTDTLRKRRDVLVRFLQAYRETIDWMYSDPAALERFSRIVDLPEGAARKLRDEFFPKEMLVPDKIVGMRNIISDAVVLDYIRKRLSRRQIAELVQLLTPQSGDQRSIFRRLRDRLGRQ